MILKPPRGAIINRRHPIANGLAAAWLFNEDGGNIVYDSSGNGNHGTIQGAAWSAGKFGPCLSFNGSSDYVDIPLIKAGSPLTYVAWAKSASDAAAQYVISQSQIETDTGDTYALGYVGIAANDPVGAAARSDTVSWSIAYTTKGFIANEWCQGASVFHNSALRRAYLDANGMGENTTDINDENDQNCAGIGYIKRLTPTGYFNGKIDHVFVWVRALTQGELAYLIKHPFCMFEVDL